MKNLSAILALAVLLTVGLACSDTTEPTTTGSNSTTATKSGEPSGATVESIELQTVFVRAVGFNSKTEIRFRLQPRF